MRTPIWMSLLLAVVLLTAVVPSASAVDIAGTWIGTMTCDLVVPENPHFRQVVRDQVIHVVMLNNYRFLLEFVLNGIGDHPMFGAAVDDGRIQTRGKVAAQACGGNLSFTHFLDADAVVNDATGAGTLTGQVTNLLTESPGFVETCRVNFRRTSAADPVFQSTCP